MKFSVSSSDLLKQLQIAGGAIGSNPVLPILEDFLFEITDNMLTISATDLETSIVTAIEVMSDGKWNCSCTSQNTYWTHSKNCHNSQLLLQSMMKILESKLLRHMENTDWRRRWKEFPRIPEADSVDTVMMDSSLLSKAISKTLFATSNDELRPAMTGVYFQVDFNKLIFVAHGCT